MEEKARLDREILIQEMEKKARQYTRPVYITRTEHVYIERKSEETEKKKDTSKVADVPKKEDNKVANVPKKETRQEMEEREKFIRKMDEREKFRREMEEREKFRREM